MWSGKNSGVPIFKFGIFWAFSATRLAIVYSAFRIPHSEFRICPGVKAFDNGRG
jgi:hypothetical protein